MRILRTIVEHIDLHVTLIGILGYGCLAVLIPGLAKTEWGRANTNITFFFLLGFVNFALEAATLTRTFDRPHRWRWRKTLLVNQFQIAAMLAMALFVWYT